MAASATRKEARKRRFGEPNAIPGGRKTSSKHKTADGLRSTTSSATKSPTRSDHWDDSSVSELRSADKVGSGEDNNEHQNLPLKNVLSPKNCTNQRFVVFVGIYGFLPLTMFFMWRHDPHWCQETYHILRRMNQSNGTSQACDQHQFGIAMKREMAGQEDLLSLSSAIMITWKPVWKSFINLPLTMEYLQWGTWT